VTPFEIFVGLWLMASPAWSGAIAAEAAGADRLFPVAGTASAAASLLSLTDEELAAAIEADLASVGSLSIGTPGGGRLVNAAALPTYPRWTIASGAISWATTETIEAIQTAIDTVHELFPESPPLLIGDISHREGGRLKRHETHQAGRDVDFGFYFRSGAAAHMASGTAATLDLPRNWALVRAILVRTDVEAILLDTRIQRLLYKHALEIGEDRGWLDQVFQFSKGARSAIIRHVAGHRNHYHVRFYNPVAQELGRRAHPILVQLGLMEPPVYTVRHVVRPGQTLGHLASRYGTSIKAIQRANGLTSTRIRAGRAYRIPVRAAVSPVQPLVIPPRMVPPVTPAALAGIEWPESPSNPGRPRPSDRL
jgi:penicillin-insensitive murein endopeptidase